MKKAALRVIVFSLITSCIALVACSKGNALTGTSWELQSYGDKANLIAALPVAENTGKQVTLNFSDKTDSYGGWDGLNSFGGSCEIKGNKLLLGTKTQTLIGLSDYNTPFGQQLITFNNLLSQVQTFTVTDNELTLSCSTGQILVFSRVVKP